MHLHLMQEKIKETENIQLHEITAMPFDKQLCKKMKLD